MVLDSLQEAPQSAVFAVWRDSEPAIFVVKLYFHQAFGSISLLHCPFRPLALDLKLVTILFLRYLAHRYLAVIWRRLIPLKAPGACKRKVNPK